MPRRNHKKHTKHTLYVAPPTPDIASTLYVACREKRRFTTEKLALRAAETRMLERFDLELSVYHCHICCGWHLTSTNNPG